MIIIRDAPDIRPDNPAGISDQISIWSIPNYYCFIYQGIVEMTRTFGLELAESLLAGYSPVFYKYLPFRCLLKGNHKLIIHNGKIVIYRYQL
jgi:hypothetical protein